MRNNLHTHLTGQLPRPLAVCTYNDGRTCGWKNDGSTWQNEWTVQRSALCLSARKPSAEQEDDSSWLPSHLVGSAKPERRDISARFSSPPVPATVGLKCLTFSFSITSRRRASGVKKPALALLQRQEG